MRVMYIATHVTMGGATQSLIDTISELIDVVYIVVVLPQEGKIEDYLRKKGVKYYIVPFLNGYGPINNSEIANRVLVDNYEASCKLANIIIAERIDLIHVNSSASNIGAISAILAGRPYVWHVREMFEEHFSMTFYDGDFTVFLMGKAYAVISISDTVRNYLYDRYGVESVRIYNGIDEKRYYDGQKNNYPPLFIICGNITIEKGQFDAICAVKKIIDSGRKDVQLFLYGDCCEGLLWRIERYINHFNLEKNIHIHSMVDDLKIIRRSAGYSITTSKMEGLGRSTIESMMAGNIVIGVDNGGTSEIIGNDKSRGFLYHSGNADDLFNVMISAMDMSESKKKEIVLNAQEYAKKTFSVKEYAKRILAVYEDALKSFKGYDDNTRKSIREKYLKSKNSVRSDLFKQNKGDDIVEKIVLWLLSGDGRRNIIKYLEINKIESVLIYGMGRLGTLFFDVIEKHGITVKGIIDRNKKYIDDVFEVFLPDDCWPRADAVIVCVYSEEESLKSKINNSQYSKCIGISDIYSFFQME